MSQRRLASADRRNVSANQSTTACVSKKAILMTSRDDANAHRSNSNPGYEWRNVVGGLSGLSELYGRHNSASVREEEQAKLYDALGIDDRSLPRNHRPSQSLDLSKTEVSSMNKHLPESNIGFKLLLRMGWEKGLGIGKHTQGIVEPVRISIKRDPLGVGTERVDTNMAIKTTENRKKLDSETQLEETEKEREQREQKAAVKREAKIQIEQTQQAFHCRLCNKQYTNVGAFNIHLDSYDHNHRKRFKEMQNHRKSSVTRDEREKKERARENRAMRHLMTAQIEAQSLAPVLLTSLECSTETKATTTNICDGRVIDNRGDGLDTCNEESCKQRTALKFTFSTKKKKTRKK